MKKHLASVAGMIMAASSVLADEEYRITAMSKFDLDGNGEITRAGYHKAFERRMQANIEWLDVNSDGVVSPQEFRDRHRAEYEQLWSSWDGDADGVVRIADIPTAGQTEATRARKDR